MPIDQGCSDCSCVGYDVLYYLCISVSLSELACEIDGHTRVHVLCVLGEGDLVLWRILWCSS